MLISTNNATAVLEKLCQFMSEKAKELRLCENSSIEPDSEGEDATGAPIMNTYIEGSGQNVVYKMTSFTFTEKSRIYEYCESYVRTLQGWKTKNSLHIQFVTKML